LPLAPNLVPLSSFLFCFCLSLSLPDQFSPKWNFLPVPFPKPPSQDSFVDTPSLVHKNRIRFLRSSRDRLGGSSLSLSALLSVGIAPGFKTRCFYYPPNEGLFYRHFSLRLRCAAHSLLTRPSLHLCVMALIRSGFPCLASLENPPPRAPKLFRWTLAVTFGLR